MRDIKRRLARLEAECAHEEDPARDAYHGLGPEGYAMAHAALATILSTHPTAWPAEWGEAMAEAFPGVGCGGAAT